MVQKMHRVSLIYLMKGVFKMNKNEHTATMYESIPAVAELNKVPGFNPLKLLRRVISPDNGETVLLCRVVNVMPLSHHVHQKG